VHYLAAYSEGGVEQDNDFEEAREGEYMPVLESRVVLELTRRVRLFLNVEAGITGVGEILGAIRSRRNVRAPAAQRATPPSSQPGKLASAAQAESRAPTRNEQNMQERQLQRVRQQLAVKNRRIAELHEQLESAGASTIGAGGIKPENLIWIFGVARTGSSWLSAMMGDLQGHARWNEPYVGDVFGYAYFARAWPAQRKRPDYVLGDEHREARLRSIRAFVLEAAASRFLGMINGGGYLVIKEPNGSIGAPLLMEALPESRMVLLVRDPRDVVASMLAAQKKNSWGYVEARKEVDVSADENPDEFVRVRAHLYMGSLERAKQAYEAHGGPKVTVRYEVLRYDTLEELRRIYTELDVPVREKELQRIVEKHAWENIPEEKKGAYQPRRKAKPGGWQEDLTSEQAKTVEEITASVIQEFYSKEMMGPDRVSD
jgi:hypothetical protein